AREKGLDCLIYIKEDDAIPAEWREQNPDMAARLAALKEEMQNNRHTVTRFASPDNLGSRVALDLHDWLFDKYLVPMLEKTLRNELPEREARLLVDGIKYWAPLEDKF